jgi:cation:H+ antiporter
MLYQIVVFITGIILLIRGGDLFVDASTSIAARLRIPPIVIGGTIVSLATTAPELIIASTASYMGDAGIAVGSVVGSAIANIGLIVGISAIMVPISIDVKDFRRRALWMLASGLVVFGYSWDLTVDQRSGLILMLIGLSYLILTTLRAFIERKTHTVEIDTTKEEPMQLSYALLNFFFGAVLVIVGSRFLVNSGMAIAQALNISSLVIGLTMIAVGASLPELVTVITSVKKQMGDLAMGSIIGANILNLSFITGVSAMIRPLSLEFFIRNYAFSWLFIMIIAMFVGLWKTGKMGKRAGIIILSLYVVFNAGILYYAVMYKPSMSHIH